MTRGIADDFQMLGVRLARRCRDAIFPLLPWCNTERLGTIRLDYQLIPTSVQGEFSDLSDMRGSSNLRRRKRN